MFKDYVTARKILNAGSALECKELAKNIDNFSKETWEAEAKKCCKVGIKEKFAQNSGLKDVLIYCTGNKKIVERANDSFWGTGVPLHHNDCLNPRQWFSQGIMGKILMEIQQELIEDNDANEASARLETNTTTHSVAENSLIHTGGRNSPVASTASVLRSAVPSSSASAPTTANATATATATAFAPATTADTETPTTNMEL